MAKSKVMNDSTVHKRQTDIYNPVDHADTHVTIVGLGNIGSHTAIALAKMGIQHFTLYDHDTVEAHNTASQAFTMSDVDTKKVDAIKAHMLAHNPSVEVHTVAERFTGTEDVAGIVIVAVDSIDVRRDIARNLLDKDVHIIDGRMGGGQVEVHTGTAKHWYKHLPVEADSDPCSARYISYTSYIIAGIITNTVKRYVMSERDISRYIMHTHTYDCIVERDER